MDFKARRVVLSPHGEETVLLKRDLVYKVVVGLPLKADLYLPAGTPAGSRLPAVIFVHGDGPWEILHDAKDWGQYRSWAELTAAAGLAAITFTHRSTDRLSRVADAVSDVADLIHYVREHANQLQIDAERVGIWVCSAGGPVGLTPVLTGQAGPIRCAAALYALLEIGPERAYDGLVSEAVRPYSPLEALAGSEGSIPPLLVVRAGQDHPVFTQAADRFVQAALARNLDLEVINYPAGLHGFDLQNDEEESRRIIRRVLDFFRERLSTDT